MISFKTANWHIDAIETVLFDKDGTFIDLHYFWGKMTEMRAEAILKHYKINQETFTLICSFLGYDTNSKKMLKDGITALYSRSKIIEILNKELKNIGISSSEKELIEIFDNVSQEFYKNMEKYTKPIEKAIVFIKKLYSKGIKLGIVTSDSVESTKLTLEHFGWKDYFQTVIGRESSESTKESGIPTKLALKELNANNKTTVMIGDTPTDYTSAKNAGIEKIILVATGQINYDNLKQTGKYVINSLDEIVL